jgi:hypothetical protein
MAAITATALLVLLAGCDQADFAFTTGRSGERFELPEVPANSRAAACLGTLAEDDARVGPDRDGREQVARLGPMSEHAFRKRQRQQQREWDQAYCRRQAECGFLASPEIPAADLSHRVESCLNHRAQRRVAMGL